MAIFEKESLVQLLAGAGCFSVIQLLVLLTLGAVLVANEHYHQLLGNQVKHAGGGLIFTGLLYVLAAVLCFYSARTQNKFLLLLNLVLLGLLFFLQLLFGGVALGRTHSAFAHELQVQCLTVGGYETMDPATQRRCAEFFASDDFAGATLVWQSYYAKTVTDGGYRAMVLNLQKDNFCCGHGLPQHCVNDSRAFPSAYPPPVLVPARRLCSAHAAFGYVSTKECKVTRWCDYDLPSGGCGLNPVTSATRGCGAFVFQTLSSQVYALASVALAFLFFPALFLVATVCLCFKRRDEDVMPDVGFVSRVKIHALG